MKQNILGRGFILLFFFASVNLYAQSKEELAPDKFSQWHTLSTGKMTADGKWLSYNIAYPNKNDTLFIESTASGLKHALPLGKNEIFSPDSEWLAYEQNNVLHLSNLYNGAKRSWSSFSDYSFLAGGQFLYIADAGTESFRLLNLKNLTQTSFKGIVECKADVSLKRLAIIIQEGNTTYIKWALLEEHLTWKTITKSKDAVFMGLTWNDNGGSLAFFEQGNEIQPGIFNHAIHLYTNLSKKTKPYILKSQDKIFPKKSYIPLSRLHISEEGSTVFFDISCLPDPASNNSQGKNDPTLEIWHGDEKQLPPPNVTDQSFNQYPRWSAWIAKNSKVRILESMEYPNVILTGDEKFALMYSPLDYSPRHFYGGDYTDLYLMDIKTGTKKCFGTKILNQHGQRIVSPSGKYIAYFKDMNWWVYDIAKDESVNITNGTNVPWHNINFDRPMEKGPYGCAGWTKNDEHILLYDQFDVWQFSINKSNKKRITKGRELNLTWRIWGNAQGKMIRDGYSGFTRKVRDLEKGFALHSLNNVTLQEGCGFYSIRSGVKEIVMHDAKILDILHSEAGNEFAYSESRFDTPPSIWVTNSTGSTHKIVQSNKQQQLYNWGKSELVYYQVDGEILKGALFYPAGYIPGKLYPMIVNIYEKKSSHLHDYFPPSPGAGDGINITNFTLAGYFVLLPDISFHNSSPGDAAVKCVTAAVEQVLQKANVDKDNIGLIGHSFGGYLTALIISKTDLFRTAVVGAPVTDPVGYYLTLDGYGESNMSRFEEYQMRIPTPYYEGAFQENSPIMNAHKIHTPLLLWVGDKDGNVPWWESMKLNNALWRLDKKHVFLVYKGEDHRLLKQANQIDLTKRIQHWFDIHLKGFEADDWVRQNY